MELGKFVVNTGCIILKLNKKIHKVIMRSFIVFAVLSLTFLTGCSLDALDRKVVFTTGFSDEEVFRIEDVSCSLTEAMVYLVNTQKGYESTFGSEIWDKETDSGTVEDRLKESVLAKVAQIKVMNLLAAENGIVLEEDELQKAQEAGNEYYNSLTEADREAMNNVTLQDIVTIMEEQALADKLYDYLIKDINPEISDDEARTITVEQILIKTYSLDNNGNRVEFSDAQKAKAYDRIRNILKQIWNGANFEELMGQYNEADEGTISFGKGEMEEAYEQAAFNLGTDQISSIVETSEGYVLIKCISTFNREETESNKVKIVNQRRQEVFGAEYDEFVSTLTKELNQKLWDSITLNDNPEVSSANLMEIYKKHFE